MAVYTDVFLATEAELQAARLETTHPNKYFPTVLAKNCTDFEFAKLEAILEGQDPYAQLDELLETFSLIQDGENCWVYRLPDRLVKRLADPTFSEVGDAAQIWANTEEMRPRNGRPVDPVPAREYLQQLTQLAMQAQQEGQNLYLWICV